MHRVFEHEIGIILAVAVVVFALVATWYIMQCASTALPGGAQLLGP